MVGKISIVLVTVCGLIIISLSNGFTASFAINPQGVRASGMNDPFSARADDPSVIFYNPANRLNGTNLSLGTVITTPNMSVSDKLVVKFDRLLSDEITTLGEDVFPTGQVSVERWYMRKSRKY